MEPCLTWIGLDMSGLLKNYWVKSQQKLNELSAASVSWCAFHPLMMSSGVVCPLSNNTRKFWGRPWSNVFNWSFHARFWVEGLWIELHLQMKFFICWVLQSTCIGSCYGTRGICHGFPSAAPSWLFAALWSHISLPLGFLHNAIIIMITAMKPESEWAFTTQLLEKLFIWISMHMLYNA